MKDFYKILEVNPGATTQEIRFAYRRMVQKYHPDKTGNNRFLKRLEELNEAYKCLNDPTKKDYYDQQFRNYSSVTNGNIILIYACVLIVAFFFIYWYLSHLSLTDF